MLSQNAFDRRGFLRGAGAATLAALLNPTAAAAKNTRPNVLLLLFDDLNDFPTPFSGHPNAITPNFQRLAKESITFQHAYSPCPLCNPARSALMTGLHPTSSGIYDNLQPLDQALPGFKSLPKYFREHGYDALQAGKFCHGKHVNPENWSKIFPRPADPYPPKEDYPCNGIPGLRRFDWAPLNVPDEAMGDWKVADWVVKQCARKAPRPFLLCAGLFRPHVPLYVPKPYFDRFPPESLDFPESDAEQFNSLPPFAQYLAKDTGAYERIRAAGKEREALAAYLASVTFSDACLGHILDGLEASGALENTVLIVCGDHGWHTGEKKHWHKMTLWEPATRIPLLIRLPKGQNTGQNCQRTVSLTDLFPTLIDLCELPPRSDLDGRSLAPLLKDPQSPWDRPALSTLFGNSHALRSERWRYIRYYDGREELYDHHADSEENHNLAYDPRFAAVRAELAPWFPKKEALPAPRIAHSPFNPAHARP